LERHRGREYAVDKVAPGKATVFLFASTQCPISNIYMPRVSELARIYKDRGIRFFLVDPNREDSDAILKIYSKERSLPFPIVRDSGLTLADWLSASRTPEAVVVDSKGDISYRGRVGRQPGPGEGRAPRPSGRDRFGIVRQAGLASALDLIRLRDLPGAAQIGRPFARRREGHVHKRYRPDLE